MAPLALSEADRDEQLRQLMRTAVKAGRKFGGQSLAEEFAAEALSRCVTLFQDDVPYDVLERKVLQEVTNARKSYQRSAQRRAFCVEDPATLLRSSEYPQLEAIIERDNEASMVRQIRMVFQEALDQLDERARFFMIRKRGLSACGFTCQEPVGVALLSYETERKAIYRAEQEFKRLVEQACERHLQQATPSERPIWRDLYRLVRGVAR